MLKRGDPIGRTMHPVPAIGCGNRPLFGGGFDQGSRPPERSKLAEIVLWPAFGHLPFTRIESDCLQQLAINAARL